MKKDKEVTRVIFRVFKGEVIAIFPEILGDINFWNCSSYQHIGQHGSCDPNYIIRGGRPAKPEEYKGLKNELESNHGYNLKVVKKHTHYYNIKRFNELNKSQGVSV